MVGSLFHFCLIFVECLPKNDLSDKVSPGEIFGGRVIDFKKLLLTKLLLRKKSERVVDKVQFYHLEIGIFISTNGFN